MLLMDFRHSIVNTYDKTFSELGREDQDTYAEQCKLCYSSSILPILSVNVPCNLRDFRHDINTDRNDSKRFNLRGEGLK